MASADGIAERRYFGRWSSVPAASAVKTTTAKYEQDDEEHQKCVGIHGSLLEEIEPRKLARFTTLSMLSSSSSRSLHPTSRQAPSSQRRLHVQRRNRHQRARMWS